MPQWSQTGGIVRVELLSDGATVEFEGASGDNTIEVRAAWWFNTPQNATVFGSSATSFRNDTDRANKMLAISGRGFVVGGSTTYQAWFVGTNNFGQTVTVKSLPAAAQDLQRLEIQVPAFPGHEGDVRVDLYICSPFPSCVALPVEAGNSSVVNVPGIPSDVKARNTFSVKASWTRIFMLYLGGLIYENHCLPHGPKNCTGPAVGGSVLKVVGGGFRSLNGPKYMCEYVSVFNSARRVQEPGQVASDSSLLCITPKWPYPESTVRVQISADGVPIERHSSYKETLFHFTQSISTLSPSEGPASGQMVTVSSASLVASSSYECNIIMPDTSGKWMPPHMAIFPAVFVDSGNLTCNMAGIWGDKFPAGTARVFIAHNRATPVKLSSALGSSPEDTVLEVLQQNIERENDGGMTLDMRLGSILRIDGELIQVMEQTNETIFTVVRGYMDTQVSSHAIGDVVKVMLTPSESLAAPSFVFRASISSFQPPELHATGGLVNVIGKGLSATYLPSRRTLTAFATAELAACPNGDGCPGAAYAYWGIGFDVFANRSLGIKRFDFETTAAGTHTVWVLARSRATCAPGEDCSHRWGDEGLGLVFWEFVGAGLEQGIDVTVGGGLTGSVNLEESFRMLAGERRGFAVVSTIGIRPGKQDTDNMFRDAFVQVEPGRILYGTAKPPGVGVNYQHLTDGTPASPYLFAGRIHYVNEEVQGDEYR
jgi:hypothetical protein